MPDVWGFQQQNHETLLQMARERRLQPQRGASIAPLQPSRWRPFALAKAPTGGIPALTPGSPDVAGKAACDLYSINDDDELDKLQDADGNDIQAVIYNCSRTRIIAGEYVNFDVDARGRYVALTPPTIIRPFQATTTITARSGTTAGTGTGDIKEPDNLSNDAEEDATIRNALISEFTDEAWGWAVLIGSLWYALTEECPAESS